MTDDTRARLEAKCYYQCPDADELYRFGCWLADNWAGPRERPHPPEPHRRWMVNAWTHEGDGEPWAGAYAHGLEQASGVVHAAREAGIDVVLVAIRVQPVDAELPSDEALIDVRAPELAEAGQS